MITVWFTVDFVCSEGAVSGSVEVQRLPLHLSFVVEVSISCWTLITIICNLRQQVLVNDESRNVVSRRRDNRTANEDMLNSNVSFHQSFLNLLKRIVLFGVSSVSARGSKRCCR